MPYFKNSQIYAVIYKIVSANYTETNGHKESGINTANFDNFNGNVIRYAFILKNKDKPNVP